MKSGIDEGIGVHIRSTFRSQQSLSLLWKGILVLEKSANKNKLSKAEQRRKKMMDTAFDLFYQKGYENVGVRDIAAQADVTTGSFYYHFKGKEDLLHKMFQGNEALFINEIPGKLTGESYAEKIIEFISIHLATLIEQDGYELTGKRLFAQDFRDKYSTGLFQSIHKLVEEGQRAGELSCGIGSEELTNFILISYRGVIYNWVIEKGQYKLQEVLHEHISASVAYFSLTRKV